MPDRGRRHLLLSEAARRTPDGGGLTGGRPRRVPRWSRGTRDHRRPARPRPARPALVDPAGAVAGGPARRAAPRHLPAHRPLRQGLRPGASRSRRSRTTSPGASTTCCGCCRTLDQPCVEPFGVISGRMTADGEPLDACLLTRHLQFSLPYRALFSQTLRPDTAQRLIDALAVLLVRLHLDRLLVGRRVAVQHAVPPRRRRLRGLPRRRRDRRAARPALSDGQREHDLDIARVNIAGELMDLEAGGFLEEVADPIEISQTASSTATARSGRELTERERVRDRRPVAGRGAHPAAQRARLRRRRAGHLDRHRRHDDPDPAQGRRRRPPLAPAAAAHRARRRGEPGPPAAQRPRRLPRRERPPGRRRGARRPRLAGPASTSRSSGPCRATWPASSSRPSCSTRCSSTGGTCPSGSATTCRSPMRSRTTSRPCCRASPTRRRSLGVDTVEMPVVAMFPPGDRPRP